MRELRMPNGRKPLRVFYAVEPAARGHPANRGDSGFTNE